MSGLFATSKLASAKFRGPVTGFFEACSKDPICPIFPVLTFELWKFLFNFWKGDLSLKPSLIAIPEETLPVPTSTVTALEITGEISLHSSVL